MHQKFVTLSAIVLFASRAFASTMSVPLWDDALSGSAFNTLLRNAPRTYQEFIDASQFSSISEPVLITGMQFRLASLNQWKPTPAYSGATWPDVPVTFSQYDVQLSQSAGSLVTDGKYGETPGPFASYQAANVQTVRSGQLTVPAGAFVADGGETGVHAYGYLITFANPYLYTPGSDLVLMIRSSGYVGGAAQANFAMHTIGANIADAISSTATAALTPGAISFPAFVQFSFAVPEPSFTAMTACACVLLRRRI